MPSKGVKHATGLKTSKTEAAKSFFTENGGKIALGGVLLIVAVVAMTMLYLKWKNPWTPATGTSDAEKYGAWATAGFGGLMLIVGGLGYANYRRQESKLASVQPLDV